MNSCDCDSYSDLALDLPRIEERVSRFRSMRGKLGQLATKKVERWIEHYRLYRCGECGQHWQASLAPRDSDTWYLYRVPRTSISNWKRAPFVPPDEIWSFVTSRDSYIENHFDLGDRVCSFESCGRNAISGLRNCHYHQFLENGGQDTLAWLDKFTWFPPYAREMIDFAD